MSLRRPLQSLLQNRRAQLLHALLIVTYLAAYTVALSAAAIGPTVVSLLRDPAQLDSTPARAAAAATEIFLFEHRVWPLALVLIVAFGAHSLLITHRIFGPLARVRREAALVARGDLARRFRFRQNDALPDLEEALNEMLGGLDHEMQLTKAAAARCRRRLAELERAELAGNAGRHTAREALAAELAALEENLSAFRTTPEARAASEAESSHGAPEAPEGHAWPDSEQGPDASSDLSRAA